MNHASVVCFAVSAVAFAACGMGLFVNHVLTGSLAISGTAAVGLIYLAMGLLNLGHEMEFSSVESENDQPTSPPDISFSDADADQFADEKESLFPTTMTRVSATREAALSSFSSSD